MWCVATCVERLSRRQQPPAPAPSPSRAPPEPLPSPPPSPSHATPSAQHPITPSPITHPPAQRPPPNARQWPPTRPPKTLAPNHPPRDGVSGWGERSGSGDGGRLACCDRGRLSATVGGGCRRVRSGGVQWRMERGDGLRPSPLRRTTAISRQIVVTRLFQPWKQTRNKTLRILPLAPPNTRDCSVCPRLSAADPVSILFLVIIIRLNVHKLLLFVHIIYRLRQLSDDFQSGVRFALHSVKTVTNLSHVRM